RHSLDSIETKSNHFRPRARRDEHVIFKLPLIPVIHHVDTRVDAGISNTSVGRQIGVPRIRSRPFEIVRLSWKRIDRLHPGGGTLTIEAHANVRGDWLTEMKDGFP